jgi:hypothetical protein
MSFTESLQVRNEGVATANADDAVDIAEVTFNGTVTGASYTPDAAISAGDGTNNRVFTIVNKGQGGAGVTVVATLTTNANALAADDEKAMTLSAVAGALTVAVGDILEFNSDANGTGAIDPGGLVQVAVQRSYA